MTLVDIDHHRRKWKLSILGVAQIVCDIFLASIFLVYVEPKLFSPVQPLLLCCLLLLHHPLSTFVGPRHRAIVGAFVAVHRPPVAFAEGVGHGWCASVLYNFIIWLRKKLFTVNSFTASGANMCQLIKSFVIA